MQVDEAEALASEIGSEIARTPGLQRRAHYGQVVRYRNGSTPNLRAEWPAWCVLVLAHDERWLPALMHDPADWVHHKVALLDHPPEDGR
jgi:hypothetical protein